MRPTPHVRRPSRVRAWFARMRLLGPAGWPALLVSAVGLALRVEHALTFNGPLRGADYVRHFSGVYWMMHHWRAFSFDPEVNWSISSYPPLWYMAGAVLYLLFHAERAVAGIAVVGWMIRQFLLSRILLSQLPHRRWEILVALTIGAFLPISVLTDGKVNPEGMHTSLFMVAVYWLWRMERQAQEPAGIRLTTAALFGVSAGLGLLTKGTSSVLPMALAILIGWQTFNALSNGAALRATSQRIILPALVSGVAWCSVAGWWCGPNLMKFGHPFPHAWDVHRYLLNDIPEMALPLLYRRPLGWALPFYWTHYLSEPILQSYLFPTPNLWAQFVTGTWSDIINRGFCRLQGGGVYTKYFDGWPVSGRCIQLFSWLAKIGLGITVVTVACVLRTASNHLRSAARKGSLALPLVAFLVVFFTSLFTLAYPVDGMVSTNARYLLPASTPMAACLAIGLSEIERSGLRRFLVGVVGVAVTLVSLLVIYERWGS